MNNPQGLADKIAFIGANKASVYNLSDDETVKDENQARLIATLATETIRTVHGLP